MKIKALLLTLLTLAIGVNEADACHAIPLVNFNQQQYIPGTGLQVTASSDSPTCGCSSYWLDMEIRCDGDIMDGSGLSAGVWNSQNCFPYYQSDTMMKPNCVVQQYPWITVPDSILCPGRTYQYRLRENHNGAVGAWTPIMTFTMPGTINSSVGHIDITASPNPFCINTQLGWTITPGTGCGTSGCNTDTTFLWESLSGDPIIVGQNFSCDTCPYPTAWPTQPTTYALNIFIGDTNACGYGIMTQTPVTVYPLPWPVAGGISSTVDCNTGDVTMVLSGYSGDLQWQENSSGSWVNIGGAITDTYVANGFSPGTCFRVEVSTQCDVLYTTPECPVIGTAVIPDFSFSNACNGEAVQFTDMSSGGTIVDWTWDFGDGNTSSNANPSHQYAGAGPFTVTLTAINSAGCSDQVSLPVNLYEKPQADFSVANVCAGQTSDFIDNSTIGSGSITDWEWDFDDGNSSTQQNPSHTYATSDNYDVKLIVTSDNGCKDTVTLVNTVYFQPIVDFTATTECSGQNATQFTNTSNFSSGTINWDWDLGDGNSSAAQDPSHLYAGTGQYQVVLIGSTSDGCADTIEHTVTVNETPAFSFVGDSLTACGDLCTQFTSNVTTNDAIASYNWDFGDGTTGTGQNPNHCYTLNGATSQQAYDVSLTLTSVNGCSATVSANDYITLSPSPVADFDAHPDVINENSGHVYGHNWSTGGTSYFWDFDDGNTDSSYAPHHVYQDTGAYTIQLIVFNQYGCSDTAYETVYVVPNPGVFCPNAFSPNGDGINDIFIPSFYSLENSDYTIQIYDRDGHVVFETDDMHLGWDGVKQGSTEQPIPGVYVWKITLKKADAIEVEEYVGHVTLVK